MKMIHTARVLTALAMLCGCSVKMSDRSLLGSRWDSGHTADPGDPLKGDADTPRPLAKGKRTYVLLQVDGGGIMGITPATVLAHLEEAMQRRRPDFRGKTLKDMLSICSGTSTGAIITGMVAAGVPASRIASYYSEDGVRLFQGEAKNGLFPFEPKYNRAKFQDTLFAVLDANHWKERLPTREVMLSDLDQQRGGAPLLVIPAYDLRSKRTHFIRSRGFKDGALDKDYDMQLVDAMSCSALNAALYFGKLEAPNQRWEHMQADGTRKMMTGAVYNDGGQGTQNNTLGLVMLEALSRGWGTKEDEQVIIISLGCGDDFTANSYSSMARLSGAAQVWRFIFKGQARDEASLLQWWAARQLGAYNANYKLFRFNFVPQSATPFSINSKQLHELREVQPQGIFARRDFDRLVDDLCDPAVHLAGPRKVGVPQKVPPHEMDLQYKLAPRGL